MRGEEFGHRASSVKKKHSLLIFSLIMGTDLIRERKALRRIAAANSKTNSEICLLCDIKDLFYSHNAVSPFDVLNLIYSHSFVSSIYRFRLIQFSLAIVPYWRLIRFLFSVAMFVPF